MKKSLILVLCLVLALCSFAACGSDSDDNAVTSSEDTTPTPVSYATDENIVTITKSADEKTLDVVITKQDEDNDDSYESKMSYNKDTGAYEDDNLSITLGDDGLEITASKDEGKSYEGSYGMQQ